MADLNPTATAAGFGHVIRNAIDSKTKPREALAKLEPRAQQVVPTVPTG